MTAAPLTTSFTGRPQHDPASVAYAERAVQMVLQRRQEAEYAAYVSSAYSASVMQGGSIGGYYGGHPAVPVLQPMGQGSPWQPMHIGGMSAGGVHAHPGTTFLGGAPHSAGGMHAEHPGAALPVRFTHTAGGVRAEYPGIASSEGPPVNAGGVRAEYPGVGHPTGASPDAGGVHAEHRSVPDYPAEALPSAGGVHAHLGTGRMTEATPIAGGVRAEHPGVGLPSAAESGAGGALSEHPRRELLHYSGALAAAHGEADFELLTSHLWRPR